MLHVGNVANNAYNNAKVLNAAGIECDVISYDYYHIMGCPEWEDADFTGTIAEHFQPDWTVVDLHGFRRPGWFAQGPRPIAIRYLLARRRGARVRAWLWRRLLRLTPDRRRRYEELASRIVVRPARAIKRVAMHFWLAHVRPVIAAFPARLLSLVRPVRETHTPAAAPITAETEFDVRVRELVAKYDELFPDRVDRLSAWDCEQYRSVMPKWKELFECYDLVEAYSTDPILPMLAGVPYVAYEHGTIREIPFMDHPLARLTALSYALADSVVITNPDCVEAARRLGVRNYRFIPHLIDRKYYDPAIRDDARLPRGVSRPFVFCPARHDWDIKGTDILLGAFARIAGRHPGLQLVTSSWGADLERSREFIREAGIEDRVVLVDPLHIHAFIRLVGQAEVLVDQFKYGVFGGIGPTALALGTPLVTYLDHSKSAWCMDTPPCHVATDVESCAEAIEQALADDREAFRTAAMDWMGRNYWHETVVSRHLEIYVEILGESRG